MIQVFAMTLMWMEQPCPSFLAHNDTIMISCGLLGDKKERKDICVGLIRNFELKEGSGTLPSTIPTHGNTTYLSSLCPYLLLKPDS